MYRNCIKIQLNNYEVSAPKPMGLTCGKFSEQRAYMRLYYTSLTLTLLLIPFLIYSSNILQLAGCNSIHSQMHNLRSMHHHRVSYEFLLRLLLLWSIFCTYAFLWLSPCNVLVVCAIRYVSEMAKNIKIK